MGKSGAHAFFVLLWDSESFYWCRSLQFCQSISHVFGSPNLILGIHLLTSLCGHRCSLDCIPGCSGRLGFCFCLPSRRGNSLDVGTHCAQMSLNLFGTCSILFLPEPLGGTGRSGTSGSRLQGEMYNPRCKCHPPTPPPIRHIDPQAFL